jgi:hypothetical protein
VETNLLNAMFVKKDFPDQSTWLYMKEHTLERNLMNVMFATKDLHSQAP